jgi:mRNA-degrading endonuclease toxin of MazEF toxin-antitoxin module
MPAPRRGEVWLIDFGLAGKTRPALVVSVAFGGRDRSLITVVPHTTSLRGSPFEIATLQAQKPRPLRGEVRYPAAKSRAPITASAEGSTRTGDSYVKKSRQRVLTN